ncbi:MAG: bifunctional UDP-sugar hydrolase/5'-nucleotidase [Gammaproteobacteria bacterium]|nr:MAG: bifunctional UDP-sugar hydrolase/5'-nucleotidase [Gammaproteobacteria bacterium]
MSDNLKFLLDRRRFLKTITVLGASAAGSLFSSYPVNARGKQRFTILHTNDMHSNFVGVGPFNDYDPATINNDSTIGGYARLATLIQQRRKALQGMGPVLVVDAGDYSMGTAFAAATRELGAELQLMSQMGYDVVTLGNHEFDLGPDGLASSITKAIKARSVPTLVASNTDLGADEPRLAGLKKLAAKNVIRPYAVIERDGIRFGVIGLMGYDAAKYALDPGGVVFSDPIETAKSTASLLRTRKSVDVVIALNHGGVIEDENGAFKGEDIDLLKAVPGIDIVVGGHTHSNMTVPQLVDNKPVVQAGRYGEHLGELVISLDDGQVKVESYRIIPVDDKIPGDPAVQNEVNRFLEASSAAVFEPRGYKLTQPLVMIDQDWPMDYSDLESGTPLANVVTDAYRKAAATDVAFTVNGLIRAGLKKGKSGIQTPYDVYALAPLGSGIVDDTAGSAMVKAYFTGHELKQILEFFLIDDPVLPGQYFPRASGMRFTYDPSKPEFDMVKKIEIGDLQSGYKSIDISGSSKELFSFTCPLYAGLILVAVPKLTKGALEFTPKKKDGTPIKSRTEALVDPRTSTSPYVLSDHASIEPDVAVTDSPQHEIKEWQAIMDYMAQLPDKNSESLSVLHMNDRAKEIRAVRV